MSEKSDRRWQFIRGLLEYETFLRGRHWEKGNAEIVGKAIVALEFHDKPIFTARQAEIEITGIGAKIKQVFEPVL